MHELSSYHFIYILIPGFIEVHKYIIRICNICQIKRFNLWKSWRSILSWLP